MRLRGLLNERVNTVVKQQIMQLPVGTVAMLFQTRRTGDKPEDVRNAWLEFMNQQKGVVYTGWKGAAKDFWDFYKGGGFGHGEKLKKESKAEPTQEPISEGRKMAYDERKLLQESQRILGVWGLDKELPKERLLTVEEVAAICPSCADKMRKKGLKRIKESVIAKALNRVVLEEAWDKLPAGWDKGSLKSFWSSLTGERKHKITACMKKMDGHMDSPGAFCASLARKMGDA